MESKKVLVVEDVKIQRKVAVMNFEALGCEVDTAETAAEALQLVNDKQYDLILMDLGLDDMGGIAATQIIRQTNKTVAIFAVTAHDEDTFRNQCLDAGMSGFIEKPITEDIAKALLSKISN